MVRIVSRDALCFPADRQSGYHGTDSPGCAILIEYVPATENPDSRTQYIVDGTPLQGWSWH